MWGEHKVMLCRERYAAEVAYDALLTLIMSSNHVAICWGACRASNVSLKDKRAQVYSYCSEFIDSSEFCELFCRLY